MAKSIVLEIDNYQSTRTINSFIHENHIDLLYVLLLYATFSGSDYIFSYSPDMHASHWMNFTFFTDEFALTLQLMHFN